MVIGCSGNDWWATQAVGGRRVQPDPLAQPPKPGPRGCITLQEVEEGETGWLEPAMQLGVHVARPQTWHNRQGLPACVVRAPKSCHRQDRSPSSASLVLSG